MSEFGGGSSFGSAVFGGEPVPFLYLQVDAEVNHSLSRGVPSTQIDQITNRRKTVGSR
ncbi:hypothetical protein LCGC14_0919330 [marine sediment metagenome]|uniref:Uncharacterized protein n=1 Tax=marine sediment metagenome TaxID=412755 RepID=A0A0F9PBY6_9ZZZZ